MASNRCGVTEVRGKIKRVSTHLAPISPLSSSRTVPLHLASRPYLSTPNRRQFVRCRTRLTQKQDRITSCNTVQGSSDPVRFVTFLILSQCLSIGAGWPVKPGKPAGSTAQIVQPDHLNYTEHVGTRALPRYR
jgi:hypothetical protein